MIAFVERKTPDMARVGELLDLCRATNRWANRGPLYARLAEGYAAHFGLDGTRAIVPVANGGIALEAMARLHDLRAGRRLRWVGSAFSFQNLGRGRFAEMRVLDCDGRGLLDLDAVRALDPDEFDGLVVVNPFGLFRDFSAYAAFAAETGKALLIDNAAGADSAEGGGVPAWPWQAFSLHHTKPYGVGEGGLALVPAEAAEDLYALLDYGPAPADPELWLNNGKLSDIACAFLIDRLERAADWAPRHRAQAARVTRIAAGLGLRPLGRAADAPPMTSLPLVAEVPLPREALARARRLTFGKYYRPLVPLPRAQALYERLINVPAHPDVAALSDDALADDIARAAGIRGGAGGSGGGIAAAAG